MTRARPSSAIRSRDLQILFLEGMLGVEQQHDDFGETDRLERVADRKLLGPSFDAHLAPQTRGVEQRARSGRSTQGRWRSTSRVMPASGPVIMRSSPSNALTRVDLPTFGRPTMAMRKGWTGSPPRPPPRAASPSRRPVSRQTRSIVVGQLADADIMLGRDRQRLAEAERIGLVHRRLGRAALAFVDGENHRPCRRCARGRRKSRRRRRRPPAHR